MTDNQFVIEFLKAPAGENEAWPEGVSKEDFSSILKVKLEGTKIKWINPITLVVFKHPEKMLNPDQGTWSGFAKQFIYNPVAVSVKQDELDKAYEKVNKEEYKDLGHLTPHFQEKFFEKTECFLCKNDRANSKVMIHKCTDSSKLFAEVEEASHYSDLFSLSCEMIYFLPMPLFSLVGTKSSLFSNYLLGAYLAFDESGITTTTLSCACAEWKRNAKIQEAIGWTTNMFLLRRLKDQGEEFQKVLGQYSKQLHMLRLLEGPLSRLSDALDATQEHSQRLRAILYDPSRSIFAVAPRVLEYFEEGRALRKGGVGWKAVHEPGTADESDSRNVKLTLAAIICEIFGKMDSPAENDGALLTRAREAIQPNIVTGGVADPAFEELVRICTAIVGEDDPFESFEKTKLATVRFKEILYRPFKDGDTHFYFHPLFVVLFGAQDGGSDFVVNISIGSRTETVSTFVEALSCNTINISRSLFGKLSLPVSRYAQWLGFLQGIIAYVKTEKRAMMSQVNIEIVPNKVTVVTIKFSRTVFEMDGINDFYNTLKSWCKRRDISFIAHGNFKKPFIDFVLAVVDDGIPDSFTDNFCIKYRGDGVTAIASIALEADKLIYCTRILD